MLYVVGFVNHAGGLIALIFTACLPRNGVMNGISVMCHMVTGVLVLGIGFYITSHLKQEKSYSLGGIGIFIIGSLCATVAISIAARTAAFACCTKTRGYVAARVG